MAMWDYGPVSRNTLPSISHFDTDQSKTDHRNNENQNPISSLSLSAIVSANPSLAHSGPPPPYSATSNPDSMPDRPGYISPPESTTRRSTREEDGSFAMPKSLPSIHEALGSRAMMQSTPGSAVSPTVHTSASYSLPPTTIKPLFPEVHPSTSNQPLQHSPRQEKSQSKPYSSTSSYHTTPVRPDFPPFENSLLRAKELDVKLVTGKAYGYPSSPRANTVHSPYRSEIANQNAPMPSYHPPTAATTLPVPPVGVYTRENIAKIDDTHHSFNRSGHIQPYGDTVKRHLDIYDIDVAFHEIHEASARTLEFSSYWSQRYHQTNRSHTTKPLVPSLEDINDMMRHSQHVMERLNRIRDIVVLQETSVPEERVRIPSVPDHAHYRSALDEYKAGGFAGVDAKKRRGKAAPPGRCHSCARAETPEWRRGPDGARTLCNACGLHYAKLTRKLGASQNAASTAPNGLPKSS